MRRTRHSRWSAVACAAACGVLGWALVGQDTHAQGAGRNTKPAPPVPTVGDRVAMRVDLRLRQEQLLADGSSSGVTSPAVVLHVERRHDAGRWHLSISLGSVDAPQVSTPRGVSTLDDPYLVTRMEYDEDGGGPPALYNASGKAVGVATDAERRQLGLAPALRRTTWDADTLATRVPFASWSGGRSLAAGLVAGAADRTARRQGLEQRFGASVGRVNGLDRFLSTSPDETEEVLVSPDSALPVEVNVAHRGALVSHVQLSYDARAGVGFVRRLMRSEHVVNAASGLRAVSEVEASNFALIDGGAQ